MVKNAQKMAENETKHFFWKIIFSYFFITYQGLTPCRKLKKSNERILRSGVQTDGRTDERTNGQRQNYRTNLQSRWVQKIQKSGSVRFCAFPRRIH